MATSRHKKNLDKRRRGLLEDLVLNLTDLSQGSANFKKAVDFSVTNINDHNFMVPPPTLVKGQYSRLLEKLELHSQMRKHAALSHSLSSLQDRKFLRNQWEEEEILYSKLSLIYHLADRVLEYTPACDIQLRLFRSHIKGETIDDGEVEEHAEQLRSIAAEFAAETDGSGSDSDTDDEFMTYEEDVQSKTPGILTELRAPPKEPGTIEDFSPRLPPQTDGSADSEPSAAALAAQTASLDPPPLGITPPPQLRSKLSASAAADPCSLLAFSAELQGHSDLWHALPEQVAHECTLVREVLAMLSGLPGRVFCIREDTAAGSKSLPQGPSLCADFEQYTPISLLHLSQATLSSVLGAFVESGTQLLRLRRQCAAMRGAEARAPRTMQALFAAVAEHLSALEVCLQGLVQGCANTVFRLPDGSASRLTLLALDALLRPRLQVLRVVWEAVQRVGHPLRERATPGQQAQHTLETLRQAAAAAQTRPDAMPGRVLRRLYVAAMEPYVGFLEAWLFQGSLHEDTLGEFFISGVDRVQDPETEEDADPMSAAASAYWQQYDMRDGGTVVHMGPLRSGNKSQLLLDHSASTIDDYYTGMIVHVHLADKKTIRSVIVAYKGAKRKAEVSLNVAPAANDQCIISTVVPLFLQPLASQIMIAGKSLNVLLLDPETRHELREILCEKPSLVSSFRDRMREINASSVKNTIEHQGTTVASEQWPSWIAAAPGGKDNAGQRSGHDHTQQSAKSEVKQERHIQEAKEAEIERVNGLTLTFRDENFRELQLLGPGASAGSLREMFEVGKSTKRGGRHGVSRIFRSRLARGLTTSSLRTWVAGSQVAAPRAVDASVEDAVERGRGVELPMRLETVPFGQMVEQGFMQGLEARVKTLNLALVSLLRGRFQLHTHLLALRRVFFMAAGDVLHVFALSLFEKLDSKQPWNDGHTLNTTLQSSLPPIEGVQYGTVTAYTADVHQAQRVQLRKGADTSITALDGLRLNYSVRWPLNLVINDRTLGIYNDVLVFLLQIKRAKCALDSDFKDEKHPITSTADDAAPRRKTKAWLNAPNTRHILLRMELRHVVNNVENYIMTQIHGDATRELEREAAAASNLDHVIAAHQRFLHKMRDRCLLHARAAVVADTIRKILDLALQFQVAYPQFERMRVLAQVGDHRLQKHNNLKVQEEELNTIASDFRRCTRLLIVVLEKIVSRGFHPHLEDLLVRLSFNGYYSSSVPSETR